MRPPHCSPRSSRGRFARLLLTGVLTATLAVGCDGETDVVEPPVDEPSADGVLLDPAAPTPVTAAEQAMLAIPLEADTAPRIDELAALNSLAQASASTCTIGFDDYVGLLILPQQAGATFAASPYYIEGCGSGWVHVKENDVARYGAAWGSADNHYHLDYEHGPYCVPLGGGHGFLLHLATGDICAPVPDPAAQPRYLVSHQGSQWIRIYVYKSGVSEMTFDFKKIRVKGAQGIKLYFRKANGSWLHWNNLGTGTWNVAPYAAGIREILIRASGGSASPYSFDDVQVGVS